MAALRTVADYQFGAGAGAALFEGSVRVTRSGSGRPRQVFAAGTAADVSGEGDRLASLGTDGRLTLGVEGGRRLLAALDPPAVRVVVGDESAPFVREGRNVFAKFVRSVPDDVRARDEVVVVHRDGDLLGVGRAELDADAVRDFETGVAVKVRQGVEP